MKLSIVTTMYRSQAHVASFCQALGEVAGRITPDYEIILVNDCSPDASLGEALRQREADPRIVIVDLARNHGEHVARMVGLEQARGDYIFLIQCDLEVPATTLSQFWEELQHDPQLDMVQGVQQRRRGGLRERLGGTLFYALFNLLSGVRIAANDAGCRLMTRRFAHALLQHRERTIFFAGLCAHTGFGQKAVAVEKARANKGSYSFPRKLAMAVNAITSFSVMPLLAVFYMGLGVLALSVAYTSYIVFKKLWFGIPVDGWTSVIVSVWFLGGCIIASLGILGVYLSRIFLEVKQRPYAIVKTVYCSEG